MNCENCVWYIYRPLTEAEIQMRKFDPTLSFDTRYCMICGCNGERFEPRKL